MKILNIIIQNIGNDKVYNKLLLSNINYNEIEPMDIFVGMVEMYKEDLKSKGNEMFNDWKYFSKYKIPEDILTQFGLQNLEQFVTSPNESIQVETIIVDGKMSISEYITEYMASKVSRKNVYIIEYCPNMTWNVEIEENEEAAINKFIKNLSFASQILQSSEAYDCIKKDCRCVHIGNEVNGGNTIKIKELLIQLSGLKSE